MKLDDLRESWRQENAEAATPASREDLVAQVCRRVERFWTTVLWRDWRETVVATAVMPVFLHKVWSTNSTPLVQLGAAIVVASLLFIVYWLHAERLGRPNAGADAPVRDYCRTELARIDGQIRLLRSVLAWYVGPPFLGVLLMFVGQFGLSLAGFLSVALLAVVAWWLHAINQRAVRNELIPMRDEILELLDQLDESESPPE